MQTNHLSSQFFSLASRNYLWAGATALSVIGMGLLSSTVMVKHPLQKLLLHSFAAGSFGAALATRHQYRTARDMYGAAEGAAMMGWAEQQVKLFAPIDQQGFDDGSGDEVEEEDPDLIFWEEINSYDPPIRAIALVLASFNIRTSLREDIDPIEEMDDRVRLHFKFPQSSEPNKTVTIKRVQGLTTEIASKASIDMPLEISAEPGGMAIDLLKEVEYAEPIAPKVEVPNAEPVAVEADEETLAARKERSNLLPDGARLIELEMLANIDRYPLVLVSGDQGKGKSATVSTIFNSLPGIRVIASPKPLSKATQAVADLIFGFNSETKQWLNFGSLEDSILEDDRDLSYWLSQGKIAGSMLDFVWACKRESMNRQLRNDPDPTPYRCFFDEAAYTYLSGFSDPLKDPNGKMEKRIQAIISSCNKDAFMNYRAQRIQTFIGTQNSNVGSIGLQNFAKAKDEGWQLYPGLGAITEAGRREKYQLKQWLERRVKEGYGIALLVKQDSIFEVLNLPSIEILKGFSRD